MTALDFYHSYIWGRLLFVAEGLYLKVFDTKESRLLTCVKIFDSQTIHGITVQQASTSDYDLKAVIWGGRSFLLLTDSQIKALIDGEIQSLTSKESIASDWILDVAIGQCSDCLAITAHNAVFHIHAGERGELSRSELLIPPSQAMLYSAHIVWTSDASFLVAGGSVFGEVEVLQWRNGRHTTLYTFTGHEGSIFGVHISPSFTGPDGSVRRLLASCSDDRTIRVWDLGSDSATTADLEIEDENLHAFRETGFGDSANEFSSARSNKRLVAVAMGHASRIWHVRFLISHNHTANTGANINILSFGEDSTCQQWSLCLRSHTADHSRNQSTNSTPTIAIEARLSHCKTFNYHTGKHLWSTAIFSDNGIETKVATGGADGRVSEFNVVPQFCEDHHQIGSPAINSIADVDVGGNHLSKELSRSLKVFMETLTQPEAIDKKLSSDVVETTSITDKANTDQLGINAKVDKARKPLKRAVDTVNRYAFVTEDDLLATTLLGRVLLVSIKKPSKWEEIQVPEAVQQDLKSYSLVASAANLGFALLSGTSGKIYLYATGKKITEITSVSRKVSTLIHVPGFNGTRITFMVTGVGCDHSDILSFDVRGISRKLDGIKTIDLPPKFVLTCAAHIGGYLVLGSRSGHLAVYDFARNNDALHTKCLNGDSKDDSVMSIVPVPAIFETAKRYFIATNRNGSYSIISLTWSRQQDHSLTPDLALVHHARPPFTTIETAWIDERSLFISGFRSKSFVVWNETTQTEVVNVVCGGAHRNYAFSTYPSASGAGNLVFTKASELYIHTQVAPSHKVLKVGGHGREIKAGAKSSQGDLFATGAEDTTIRIWRYEKPRIASYDVPNELKCLAVMQKHAAGIQHLQFSAIPSDTPKEGEATTYLFSGGGNEEFNVWRISPIPYFGLGVILETSLEDYSEDRDLRIMSFDVKYISSTSHSEGIQRVAIAYSDSTIKIFHYTRDHGFKRIAEARYTAACITQINMLPTAPNTYLTASTDGHIALWRLPSQLGFNEDKSSSHVDPVPVSEMKMIFREKLHQSNIAALAIHSYDSNDYIIATGGDDNALCITFLSNWKIGLKIRVPDAHAAIIAGLEWADQDTGSLKRLWSVGGDQRLKHWILDIKDGSIIQIGRRTSSDQDTARILGTTPEIEVKDVRTSVADAAGLVTLRRGDIQHGVLVYGTGVEVFKI